MIETQLEIAKLRKRIAAIEQYIVDNELEAIEDDN